MGTGFSGFFSKAKKPLNPVPIGLLLCYNEQEGGKKWSILSLVQPGI